MPVSAVLAVGCAGLIRGARLSRELCPQEFGECGVIRPHPVAKKSLLKCDSLRKRAATEERSSQRGWSWAEIEEEERSTTELQCYTGVVSGSRPDPRQGRGPDQVWAGRRNRQDRLAGEEIGGERWRRACAGRFCIWNGNRCGRSTGATCGAR